MATVGVLRGPLFGISDDELYQHRKEGGGGFTLLAPGTRGHPPVLGALQTLNQMHAWTRELPASCCA